MPILYRYLQASPCVAHSECRLTAAASTSRPTGPTPGTTPPARLATLAAAVVSGGVHVEVEQVYPFERGVEALEKTGTRRARGRSC